MKSTAVLIVVPALKEYDFVEKAAMCVYWKDRTAVCSTKTGRFSANNIFGRSSLGVEGGLCQNGKGIQIRFCKRREVKRLIEEVDFVRDLRAGKTEPR